MAANQTIQDIDALKKRHKALDKEKTTAEANHKMADEQLQKLRVEALDKFGTDDIEQLKKKLAEMKADNDRKRVEYQKHLETIELRLVEIEKQYASDE